MKSPDREYRIRDHDEIDYLILAFKIFALLNKMDRTRRTLLEEWFSHPRHAGGIWSLIREYNKGLEHGRGAVAAAYHAMPNPWKQEEVALGERLRRQFTVSW